MNRKFAQLSPRSYAFSGLLKLAGLAGAADFASLRSAMAWSESDGRFLLQVVNPLLLRGYIFVQGNRYCITDVGQEAIGDSPAVPPYQGVPAGPAYAPPMRPLSARHRPDRTMRREGSFDYLDIPSRIGDHFVPHGVKAQA